MQKRDPFQDLFFKSARRGSNPRTPPWQGGVVPLYYSRICFCNRKGSFQNLFLKSARRGSNPRTPPWQGGVVPLYYSRIFLIYISCAQGRNRTNDIRIFSPPLYQLSYLGRVNSTRCRRPESNRYEYRYSRDFKSRASASSATAAFGKHELSS